MTAKSTLSTRVPEWLEGELRARWDRWGKGPSEGLRQVLVEWWVREELSALEFRDNLRGREAALRGGPEVWKLQVLERCKAGSESVADHLGGEPGRNGLEQAREYSRRCPDPVEERSRIHDRAVSVVRRLSLSKVEKGKLLLGWEIPVAVASALREGGIPARHVAESDPSCSSVREQLVRATERGEILVTGDYAEIGEALQGIGGVPSSVALVGEELCWADASTVARATAAWWAAEETDGSLSPWIETTRGDREGEEDAGS